MNTQRLLKLADLLEADATNPEGCKFDLDTWATYDEDEYFPTKRKFKQLNCNTQACAVGLACLSGAFKAEGLSWRPSWEENNIVPLFKRKAGFPAVEAFFGINNDAAHFLFASYQYVRLPTVGAEGERAVAKRIREFVTRRSA